MLEFSIFGQILRQLFRVLMLLMYDPHAPPIREKKQKFFWGFSTLMYKLFNCSCSGLVQYSKKMFPLHPCPVKQILQQNIYILVICTFYSVWVTVPADLDGYYVRCSTLLDSKWTIQQQRQQRPCHFNLDILKHYWPYIFKTVPMTSPEYLATMEALESWPVANFTKLCHCYNCNNFYNGRENIFKKVIRGIWPLDYRI